MAGDMYSRGLNYSNPFTTAVAFQCMRKSGDSPYSSDMRTFQKAGANCDQSLRATIAFPSCWNGQAVTSANGQDHVAYPVNNVCPASHPIALMQMTYETYYLVEN